MKSHHVLAGLFTVAAAAALGNRTILLVLGGVYFVGWLFTFVRSLRDTSPH